MASPEAFINPQVLKWARERSFSNVGTAATALKVPEWKLDEWERGASRPTFRQAQTLASQLRVPFGYLFLSSTPTETIPLPDFRTVAHGEAAGSPSRDFLDVVNEAVLRQEWYKEYQEDDGAQPLPFIGVHSIGASRIEQVARFVDETFGVRELARRVPDRETFLRDLTRNTEAKGVLVMRSKFALGNQHRWLRVDEFRGFAITDSIAPLIFINAEDALGAQVFTFVHELSHLVFGESGISNPNYRSVTGKQDHVVEDACDEVTAETLMPSADFSIAWQDAASVEVNLAAVTARYRASNLAAMRRARDLGKITDHAYWDYYEQHAYYSRPGAAPRSPGGTFYPTFFVRNSRLFSSTVVTAVAEGRLPYRDAAGLLNVKVQTLSGMANELFGVALSR